MKMNRWLVVKWALVVGLGVSLAKAQETAAPAPAVPASPTGVIKENNVNVRGKATIHSEVVTQLQEGDRVAILEEVTPKDPKKGDPEKWLRISLPPSAGVWVHGSFIDPATKTVKADLLNMRGGPGENYSVLGRIPTGTVVTEIETKGPWVKIQAPDQAYAFIAAFLVDTQSTTPPPVEAPAVTSTEAAPPVIAVAPTPAEPAEPAEPTEPAPVETVAVQEPATDPTAPAPAEPLPTPPPTEPVPVEEIVTIEESPIKPAEPPPPPPKRIISREGIVRRTMSIQAPTEFCLHDVLRNRMINYLNAPSTNIVLRDYFGMKILVTGEELLDERWKTPVINIEKLEPME